MDEEGVESVSYATEFTCDEIKKNNKEIWIFRIPKQFDLKSLDGVKTKWKPKRKGTELGMVKFEGSALSLTKGDPVQLNNFRIALSASKADPSLQIAQDFTGLVTAQPPPETLPEVMPNVEAIKVEPYRGLPRPEGLRVRYHPIGSGATNKKAVLVSKSAEKGTKRKSKSSKKGKKAKGDTSAKKKKV
eukprot:CAMPEP_0113944978 /NCGR_PEP_ID=MMETSP1339-20121228/38411_1 /TAXON_ID=94617 /ORGANISM="Fibrocapsa japonica" /LENGTH=187 /DNA_ID=CAMNT_0000950359 /DNA_START=36 /DNA_END=599 /DNA_ORIENTATION=- /assembly_acc=CAM_ASM_000762